MQVIINVIIRIGGAKKQTDDWIWEAVQDSGKRHDGWLVGWSVFGGGYRIGERRRGEGRRGREG